MLWSNRKNLILAGLLVFVVTACAPKIVDNRMIPPPETSVEVAKTSLLKSALANYYGHHSVGKINYKTAMKLFKLLRGSEEKQQGVISFYCGMAKLKGLAAEEIDYSGAMYFFDDAFKKIREYSGEDIDGNNSLVLALMYRDGLGVEKKLDKVLPLLHDAEKKGNNFAPLIMAEFLLENGSDSAYRELAERKLFAAMQYGFPQAYYLAYLHFPNLNSEENLLKSAEGNYPDAMIDVAINNGNKMAIHSANNSAMEMGSARGFYNLSVDTDNIIEKVYLLKQAALRGNYQAISELALHYEHQKLWSIAIAYNLFALQDTETAFQAKLALERLESISGLNVLIERFWKNRNYAELSLLDNTIDFYIHGFENNVSNIRSEYQKYLMTNSKKAFMNCDWYYISNNKLPMELAGDIFKYYLTTMEPQKDNIDEFNNYFLAYAVAAGLAGQGELQKSALGKVKNYSALEQFELALKFLEINAEILSGNAQKADELLANLKINEKNRTFAVNFINGCSAALLLDRERTARTLELDLDSLLATKEIKKQPFFNFENGKTITDLLYEEPRL